MEGDRIKMRKKISFLPYILITAVLIGALYFPLPYFVSKPGMAKELEPIINIENGYHEKGSFMLTTVRMGRANIYSYLTAKVSKYDEIYPLDMIMGKKETEEEFNTRQLHMMEGSKESAIETAFKKAGIPVQYRYKGVYVLDIVPGMPAAGKLKSGDRLLKIDGHPFISSGQFIESVSKKHEGDSVKITFSRRGKTDTANMSVKKFKNDPKHVGVGIGLVDDKDLITQPKVKIKTDEIGGPSAGLMFSLEIYNQLTKEDLTRNYEIAGTGTISPDGMVGPIGGIEQKIIAADKAGAEIFFAPNEKGAKDSNYRAAVKTAKDIDTNMKIIPVDTFNDAVHYLEKLKMKS